MLRRLQHEVLETRTLLAFDLVATLDGDVTDLAEVDGQLYAFVEAKSLVRVNEGVIWTVERDDNLNDPGCSDVVCILDRGGNLKNLDGELVFHIRTWTSNSNAPGYSMFRFDDGLNEMNRFASDVHRLADGRLVFTAPETDGDIEIFGTYIEIEGFRGRMPGAEVYPFFGDTSVYAAGPIGDDLVNSTVSYYDSGQNSLTTIRVDEPIMAAATLGDDLFYLTAEDKLWVLSDGEREELFSTKPGRKSITSGRDQVFFSNGPELWRYDGGASMLGETDSAIASIHVAGDSVFAMTFTDIWVYEEAQMRKVASRSRFIGAITPVQDQLYWAMGGGLFHTELGLVHENGRNVMEAGDGSVFFSAGNSIYQVVDEENTAPVVADDQYSTFREAGVFTTPNVLSNDTDIETPDSLSAVLNDVSQVLGQVTSNGDGTFDYDPAGTLDFLSPGESIWETFTYDAVDEGGLNSTATVTIRVTAALPGDANLDGRVDTADLNALTLNWLADGTTWSSGDFNRDGRTDALDLNAVGLHWQQNIDPVAAAFADFPIQGTRFPERPSFRANHLRRWRGFHNDVRLTDVHAEHRNRVDDYRDIRIQWPMTRAEREVPQ